MSEFGVYKNLEEELVKHGPLFGESQGVPWVLSASWFALTNQQLKVLTGLGPTLRTFMQACDTLYYNDPEVRALMEQGKPPYVIDRQRSLREGEGPLLIRPDMVMTEDGLKITEIETIVGGLGMYSQIKESYQKVVPPTDGSTPYSGSIVGTFIDTVRALPGNKEKIILTPSFNSRYLSDLRVFSTLCAHKGYEVVAVPADSLHAVDKDGAKAIWRLFEIYEVNDLGEIPDIPIYPPLKQFTEEKAWMALLHFPKYQQYWAQALGTEGFQELKQIVAPTWLVQPDRLPMNLEDLMGLSKGRRRFVTKLSGYSEDSWGARSFTFWPERSTTQWQAFLTEAVLQTGVPHIMQAFQESLRYSVPALVDGEVKSIDGLSAKISPFYFFGKGSTQLADIGVILRKSRKVHGARDSIRLPVSIV